jgi:hypothetical protein
MAPDTFFFHSILMHDPNDLGQIARAKYSFGSDPEAERDGLVTACEGTIWLLLLYSPLQTPSDIHR